jgi:hypothetical protein
MEVPGRGACEVEVAVDDGLLTGRLALAHTKHGGVQASAVLDAAMLEAPGVLLDVEACPKPPSERVPYAGPADLLLGALGSQAIALLSPELGTAVPAALGLDVATGATIAFGDDGLGSGAVQVLVRAPDFEKAPKLWQYVDGHLVLPFEVALHATPHPCAPPAEVPLATASPVPQVTADAAVMVHQDVLRKAAVSLLQAGAFCRERPARDLAWTASELAAHWPDLALLEPDSEVRVRVWPTAAPQLAFGNAGDDVHVLLDTGLLALELMGEVEGAAVRLATVEVAVTIGSHVAYGPGGTISLEPKSVDVSGVGLAPGLLPPPPEDLVPAFVDALAPSVLEAGPLGVLPPLPGGPPDAVRVQGAYVVFSREGD